MAAEVEGPWWAVHVEHAPAGTSGSEPESARPAPFSPDLAAQVPDYDGNGRKTTGLLDLGSEVRLLESGYDGDSRLLPRPPLEVRPGERAAAGQVASA